MFKCLQKGHQIPLRPGLSGFWDTSRQQKRRQPFLSESWSASDESENSSTRIRAAVGARQRCDEKFSACGFVAGEKSGALRSGFSASELSEVGGDSERMDPGNWAGPVFLTRLRRRAMILRRRCPRQRCADIFSLGPVSLTRNRRRGAMEEPRWPPGDGAQGTRPGPEKFPAMMTPTTA